jgi:hypothetical protein
MNQLLKALLLLLLLLLLCIIWNPFYLAGQHTNAEDEINEHNHHKNLRVALLIGHTLIPEQHAEENFFIPSWGLDLEYWANEKWGIGIHTDLEIETFVIIKDEAETMEIDRVTPLVLTIDALIKPWKGLVLQIGPGIELEKEENYELMRVGAEYEIELTNHWDVSPTIFYDTRFNEYHTWSIALGIGKRF